MSKAPDSAVLLARADRGSAEWWRDVAAVGTPLRRALPDGAIELSFLWRGHASEVYIDVYSHTPHPTTGPTRMLRLDGSDVWVWRTRLPADWCGSYFFLPAGQQDGPPAVSESDPTARQRMRRWWTGLMENYAQADAFSRLPPHGTGWGVPLSALLLPDADVHPAWRSAGYPLGELRRERWQSAAPGMSRDVWTYRTDAGNDAAGPDGLPLVVLLDGQYWARQMPVFGALDQLTAAGQLPPAFYLLIDAVSPEQRAHDLPCADEFWLALQEELLPQLEAGAPLTWRADRTVVAGQSFGGLAALHAGLHWPQRFGRVLSQSGSFWWPEGDASGRGWLIGQVAAGLGRGADLDIVLEVGCYESDMRLVSRAMASALENAGLRIHYSEFRGGHDWLCWRDGLLRGLERLMKDF